LAVCLILGASFARAEEGSPDPNGDNRGDLLFIQLGGTGFPITVAYEHCLGDWTVGGGVGMLALGDQTFFILSARSSLSLWPVAPHNVLLLATGLVSMNNCGCYGSSCEGRACDRQNDVGLTLGIAYESRSSMLWRLEVAAMWIYDSNEQMVSIGGIPLLVYPGVACGFVF
jgi:hypothetical protein